MKNYSNVLNLVKKSFVLSAGVLLLLTGIAKLISITGSARILDTSDPVFTILNARQMLLIASVLEIAIGTLALLSRAAIQTRLLWISWLASLFGLYRVGLWLVDHKMPCKCLGGALDWAGLSDPALRNLSLGLFVYLLAGGYILFFIGFFREREIGGVKAATDGAKLAAHGSIRNHS